MIGMYGPSFFTGTLIQRYGVLNVIFAGIVLLLSQSGWRAVNYGSIPFLLLAAGATLWLWWRRRAAGPVTK